RELSVWAAATRHPASNSEVTKAVFRITPPYREMTVWPTKVRHKMTRGTPFAVPRLEFSAVTCLAHRGARRVGCGGRGGGRGGCQPYHASRRVCRSEYPCRRGGCRVDPSECPCGHS